MSWSEAFTNETKPDLNSISTYVNCANWEDLCTFIEQTYQIKPSIEYSKCSGAPGWNVKYKKSSRSLCTLYPERGRFICLISIGRKEAPEAELILTACSQYVQELYKNTVLYNGSRWLMIDVTTDQIQQDVKELLCIRIHPPKNKEGKIS